jgi:hypothetical protein
MSTVGGAVRSSSANAGTVYDNQTRSLLPTDQKSAGLDSTRPGIEKDADGGATV